MGQLGVMVNLQRGPGPRSILGLLVALLLVACSGNQAAETVTTEQLAQGKTLYESNCASCHGLEGEGEPEWQNPDASGSFPAPPHDGSGHTWHHPDQLLLQIIAEGGQMPNSRMPAFEEELTREEMEAILAYIKTFWTPEQREIQAEITQRQP
ncbi:MAG: cytochrome c [Chloroflexota bacterium]|nr:cytochrome c [Chloroflexota bacterium]